MAEISHDYYPTSIQTPATIDIKVVDGLTCNPLPEIGRRMLRDIELDLPVSSAADASGEPQPEATSSQPDVVLEAPDDLRLPNWRELLSQATNVDHRIRTGQRIVTQYETIPKQRSIVRDILTRDLTLFSRHARDSFAKSAMTDSQARRVRRIQDRCFGVVQMQYQDVINAICRSFGGAYGRDQDTFKEIAQVRLFLSWRDFDLDADNQFATYLDRSIRGDIKRHLRDSNVKSGVYSRSEYDAVSRVAYHETRLGSDEELIEQLGITAQELAEIRNLRDERQSQVSPRVMQSFDVQSETNQHESGASDTEKQSHAEGIHVVEFSNELRRLDLNALDLQILALTYGIFKDAHGNFVQVPLAVTLNQNEIAKQIGYAQSYISRRLKGIHQNLKRKIESSAKSED